jgi:pyoverdine/dityrosine biosynthesis protein Dit1
MRVSLDTMINRQQPLMLPMLMGGAKAPNPVKVGSAYLPDLSEWTAWSMLDAIGVAIESFYRPGALAIAVPDAALHTADIGMPIEEAVAHTAAAEKDLRMLGLTHVHIPNTLEFLNDEWVQGVEKLLATVKERRHYDTAFAESFASQTRSLVYSLNTRVLDVEFETLLLIYAAIAGHTSTLAPDHLETAADLTTRAARVTTHYTAVNWAIRRLGLVERIVASMSGSTQHFRMSVHAKPGEPRPQLFTPSKYFPNLGGLLPMHAVGVRLLSEARARNGAAFELTARLRKWTPVHANSGRFLWYEASSHRD